MPRCSRSAVALLCMAALSFHARRAEADAAPAGPTPAAAGWRQDWTGRFPDATPPTSWGRTLKNSMVRELRCQPGKPASNTNLEDSIAMPDGLLLSFMVCGPFDAKDPASAIDEETLPQESELGPATGKQPWQKLLQDRPTYVQWDVSPASLRRALGKPRTGQVGYAHAYVYSPRAGKASLMLDHSDGCRLWVNGKSAYSCPTSSVAMSAWQAAARARFEFTPEPLSARIGVDLTNGWNRLLFKVAVGDGEWGGGCAILPRFTEPAPPATQDRNIRWATPLSDAANAGPLVVGARVLTTAEPDELICVNKADGRVMWHRANSFYEATPHKDREKYARFSDARSLSVQIAVEENPQRRAELRRQLRSLLLEASSERYAIDIDELGIQQYAVNGFASCTPCSDGKRVYAWFAHGVAACYDLEGQRQWIRRVDEMIKGTKEKYSPAGPPGAVLTGNRFIVWHRETVALDAATGEVVWRQPRLPISLGVMPVQIAGQDAILGVSGILRTADGAILWENRNRAFSQAGGTFGDNLFFLPAGPTMVAADFSLVHGDKLVPSMMSATLASGTQLVMRATDFSKAGDRRDIYQFSAPLYQDGLVYQVDNEGMLYVLESKPLRLLYRRQLPLEPAVCRRSLGVCAPLAFAGGNVYAMDNQGTTVVFAPGKTYRQIAVNRIESFVDRPNVSHGWREFCTYGAPAFDGDCIYVRGESCLYCIGAP